MVTRDEIVGFLQGWSPWEATNAPVDGPTPMPILAVLSGLRGLKKMEYKIIGCGFDQNISYVCIKLSNGNTWKENFK